MDFESLLRQVEEKYLQETELRVNKVDSEMLMFIADTFSQLDSSIQKHFEDREHLEKSRDYTLIEIKKLEEDLAQLETDLSDAIKRKEDILITSHRQLSSLLGVALAELEPEKKKIQAKEAKVKIASYRKKLLSQQVPITTFTKLVQAQADETISAANQEIHKLTQASQHLTDQVTQLQSKLDSANRKWEEHMDKIISLERDIRLCERKLTQAKSNAKSYCSELELVAYAIKIDNQTKEELQEKLSNYEAGLHEDDSEKNSVKSSNQRENQQPPPLLETEPSQKELPTDSYPSPITDNVPTDQLMQPSSDEFPRDMISVVNHSINVQMLGETIRKLQEDNTQMRSILEIEMQVQVQQQVERQVREHMQQWVLEVKAREEAREEEWQQKMNDINLMLRKFNDPHPLQ